MAESKAQKEARKRYYAKNKEQYRDFDRNSYYKPSIRIRKDDEDVINHLKSQESLSAYIVNLIREDMKKGNR